MGIKVWMAITILGLYSERSFYYCSHLSVYDCDDDDVDHNGDVDNEGDYDEYAYLDASRFSTVYPVIGDPPSSSGFSQVKVTEFSVTSLTLRSFGTDGTSTTSRSSFPLVSPLSLDN